MDTGSKINFLSRPSLRRAFFFALLYAGAVLYGRIITDFDPELNRYWLMTMVLLLAILGIVLLRRACTSYIITDEEVQVKSGIIARHYAVVPVARVTNAYLRQSMLDRLLFIANLQIDCAGGDTREINFRRITTADAKEAGQILRALRTKRSTPRSSLDSQEAA